MRDAIPTCGWCKKLDNTLIPCGEPAIAVHQVWAVPVDEFMTNGDIAPMALLVCREHEPREVLHVH